VAGVSVPTERFVRGDFPMVCVTSGRPADVRLGVRFRGRRGGPAPSGLLPFSSVAQQRLKWLVRIRHAVLAGGFVVLALLSLTGHWHATRVIGVPVAALAFTLNIVGAARSIDGRADATESFVHLRGVHRNFVAALLTDRG
jgi:hypothetical protein